MPVITINPDNVKLVSGTPLANLRCKTGGNNAGEWVWDNNGVADLAGAALTVAEAKVHGMLINSGAEGQTVTPYAAGSKIDVGNVLTKGESYSISPTLGKMIPTGELVATNNVTWLCVAESTNILIIHLWPSGQVK